MLQSTTAKTFKHLFNKDPHPFISEQFIELNRNKVDQILRLVSNENRAHLGLVAGIKDKIIQSPFSAPFGGLHFLHNHQYISEIDGFIESLKEYLLVKGFKRIEITLPPEIYNHSINAKLINSFIRAGFNTTLPDITNWVDLDLFQGKYNHGDSRTYYRQGLRNDLSFGIANDLISKRNIYNIICDNRKRLGRPIYMKFTDLQKIELLWPVHYYYIASPNNEFVASAILYHFHPSIVFAVFWGDNESGRIMRAMDFLLLNLWNTYKRLGIKYIDLGISSESGIPNNGLLRFKETHNCTSGLRYKFCWSP